MGLLIDVELLIAAIEERPAIWDKSSDAYRDRNLTKVAWHEVCCVLKDGFEELSLTEQHDFGKSIIGRWTNVRDTWMKYQKKAIGLKKFSKYRYHDKLGFLVKVLDNLSTHSQATEETNEETKDQHEKTTKKKSTSVKSSNQDTKVLEPVSTSHFQGPSSSRAPNKKRKCEDIESRLLKLIRKSETPRVKADPHLLFFESLLPSLINLNEDQELEFRIGVLALIKKIKQQREYPDPLSTLPHAPGASDRWCFASKAHPSEKLSPCSSVRSSPISLHRVKSSPSSASVRSVDLDNYDFSND